MPDTHWTLENSLTYTDLRISVHLLLIPGCTTKCKTPYKVSPRLFAFSFRDLFNPGEAIHLARDFGYVCETEFPARQVKTQQKLDIENSFVELLTWVPRYLSTWCRQGPTSPN